jgi:hypothetical protein
VPDDFYFIYEILRRDYDVDPLPEPIWFNPIWFNLMLHTKHNIIGTEVRREADQRVWFQYYYTDYHMPKDRLKILYDDVVRFDLKALAGLGVLTVKDETSELQFYIGLTFQLENEVYSLIFDDTVLSEAAPSEYRNLQAFCAILMNNDYTHVDVPDDFYFIYETGDYYIWYVDGVRQEPIIYLWVNLDTENNIIGGWGREAPAREGYGSVPKHCYVDYYMPQDRLRELYNNIINYDIQLYSSPGMLTGGFTSVQSCFRFTFRMNGEIYSITVLDYAPAGYQRLRIFHEIVMNKYFTDTDEGRLLRSGLCYC